MPKIKIDNRNINAPEGISVLAAARMSGIEIPSLCYREGKEHFTSCMICMIKDRKNGKLFPSCSVKVSEGMDLISIDEEIEESRRVALELLLSDHVGDCEAPCQVTCPAHMDIPRMNRLILQEKYKEAIAVVKKDIAMPATFGRICPAPCEGACKRKHIDAAVSICLLKRFVGDYLLNNEENELVPKESAKKIAVVGAGPAGLAAIYYLGIEGHKCSMYEQNDKAGGTLWNEVEKGKLEEEILVAEIKHCMSNSTFFGGEKVDKKKMESLIKSYDAVLLCSGDQSVYENDWQFEADAKGVLADKNSFRLGNTNVFAAGSSVKPAKLAIRCHGQGKDAAHSINLFLKGEEYQPIGINFNSRFGKLSSQEQIEYLKESVAYERLEPKSSTSGYDIELAGREAARCLHCDCRDLENCKLRLLSDEYNASQKHYWSEERKQITKQVQHDYVIYEPAKCIKCGICVFTTEDHKEKYGMSFIGRGFDVVVGVPLGESVREGLSMVAEQVVKSCPTGALSLK